MPTINRSAVRHPKFSECVQIASRLDPRAESIIDGAVWEIERSPRQIGIHIAEMDVWQARLVLSSQQEILLLYCINPRYVTMLTIINADGSKLE